MGRDPQYLSFIRLVGRAREPASLADERASVEASLGRLVRASVAHVEDLTLGGLPARLYHPAPGSRVPGLVFFHGGGFALGSVEAYDPIVRMLVAGTGCAFLSVEYRLAPEHPFPAAVEDARAATSAALGSAGPLGLSRVGVAGDSSGANLAAVTALHLRERLAGQVLLYGVYDLVEKPVPPPDPDGVTTDDGRWPYRRDAYLGGADPDQPDASPLRAPDLGGLPPAVVLTAEFDKLCAQGEAYADRLRAAGVPVTFVAGTGLDHAFLAWTAFARRPAEVTEQVCGAIRGLMRVGSNI